MTATAALPGAETLHFDLDWRDALAWERHSPKHRSRDRVAVAASFFAGIGLVQVIGGNFASLRWLHTVPAAVAVMALPVFAVVLLQWRWRRLRAIDHFPETTSASVDIAADRISQSFVSRRPPVTIGARSLRGVVETRNHVFLTDGSGVVIIPARAFASAAAKAAFAAVWRGRLRD